MNPHRTIRSALLKSGIPAAVLWGGLADAQVIAPEHPIDLGAARATFEQASALADTDAGSLWGTSLNGPLLLVDPTSRFAVANVPDGESNMRPLEGVFVGTLPESINIANTTTAWAGVQWAMVMWPLPADERERGTLIMHESFHRVQPELGFALSMRDNHHLDGANGRAWLRLELRALAVALGSEGESREIAVRDALTFRAFRRALAQGSKAEERDVELNEGLAEYTGLRLGGYDASHQRERTISRLHGADRSSSFVRSFAYVTGPAYGLLLDEAAPDWRATAKQSSDLGDLLGRAIRASLPRELEAMANERSSVYGGEEVLTEETKREEARIEEQATLRATFVDGPILRIPLDGQTNFSFDPHGVRSRDGVGTVYASMRVTAEWGVLQSTGPILWVTEGGASPHLRVPAPEDAAARPVTGPTWTLTLNEGWRLKPEAKRGNVVIARDESS